MYERFTDRARKVMQLANQEAQRFNHEYIGTDHILLGLVKEGSGVAANVLKNLDVDLRKIRLEVEKLVQSGPEMVTMGKLPQTPRAKKVIELAIENARALNHSYVDTEHLLLGMLAEKDGIACQVLTAMGLDYDIVRNGIVELLTGVRTDNSIPDEDAAVAAAIKKLVDLLGKENAAMLAKKIDGQPYADFSEGMSLRDWFAGQIAAGDAASDDGWSANAEVSVLTIDKRVRLYYRIADAMIRARSGHDGW